MLSATAPCCLVCYVKKVYFNENKLKSSEMSTITEMELIKSYVKENLGVIENITSP